MLNPALVQLLKLLDSPFSVNDTVDNTIIVALLTFQTKELTFTYNSGSNRVQSVINFKHQYIINTVVFVFCMNHYNFFEKPWECNNYWYFVVLSRKLLCSFLPFHCVKLISFLVVVLCFVLVAL